MVWSTALSGHSVAAALPQLLACLARTISTTWGLLAVESGKLVMVAPTGRTFPMAILVGPLALSLSANGILT